MQDIVKRRLEGGDFSSDEDKNEIRASIDFNKFSVEELLTYVEESKLYTIEEIKQRVIKIDEEKDDCDLNILIKVTVKLSTSKPK